MRESINLSVSHQPAIESSFVGSYSRKMGISVIDQSLKWKVDETDIWNLTSYTVVSPKWLWHLGWRVKLNTRRHAH
jgi:hypothetical protein